MIFLHMQSSWRKKLIYRRTHSNEWQQPEKKQHTRKNRRIYASPKNPKKKNENSSSKQWDAVVGTLMTASRRNRSPSLSSQNATPKPSIPSSLQRMCVYMEDIFKVGWKKKGWEKGKWEKRRNKMRAKCERKIFRAMRKIYTDSPENTFLGEVKSMR